MGDNLNVSGVANDPYIQKNLNSFEKTEQKIISTFGTEIVDDGQQTPTTNPTFMNAGQFSSYFGNGAQKANQSQYNDLKAGISKQQQLIRDAGGTPPPMPSYEDFSANKKGAEAYMEALRDYNNSLVYETQIAQTKDVKETIVDTSAGLRAHIAAEGGQTRAEGFAQYADLKGDIKDTADDINANVDREGAATRKAVHAEGAATRGKVVVTAQRIIKNDRDLATQQIRQEAETQKLIKDSTAKIINNNNEQTEILDPSGVRRGMHAFDEWIEGLFD